MKVSILILTYNEAINLPACLEAIAWCDDILVVDSGSTDDTCAIAARYRARLLSRPFDNFAGQRNYGLEEGGLRHDWVLHLDADEIVTPEFARALAELQPTEGLDAYRVPFKTIFFGKWLRYAGMWPAYQVRIGHLRRLRFIQVGHGQREDLPTERVGSFPEALDHYSFSHGLRRWLEKHVRYAADEADEAHRQASEPLNLAAFGSSDATDRRRAAKRLAMRLPLVLRPLARFIYIYLLRGGFRDGRGGFVYAFMLATYEAMIAILGYERHVATGGSAVSPRPHSGAERRN